MVEMVKKKIFNWMRERNEKRKKNYNYEDNNCIGHHVVCAMN